MKRAIVIGVVGLAGCASAPHPMELTPAGPEPSAEQAERVARAYLAGRLKDPVMSQFDV